MENPGPRLDSLVSIQQGIRSTVWPSDVSDAMLATTSITTKNGVRDLDTETALDSSMFRQDKTFLLLFGQAVPLVLLATVTVVCNLMVLLMFRIKRSLRSCKNMYLASLAVADLLVGVCMFIVVLPQLRGTGPFLQSGIIGDAYHVIRQAALYVSLLSLMLITIDRWWSIHHPFSYRARRRKRNAALAVGTVWLFSFALHVVPVIIWEILNASDCAVKREMTLNSPVKVQQESKFNPVFNISYNTFLPPLNTFFAEHNTTILTSENGILFMITTPPLSFSSNSFLSNGSINTHSNGLLRSLESVALCPDKRPLIFVQHNKTANHRAIPDQTKSLRFWKWAQGLPLYEGLPIHSDSALMSLAWDVQYLIPLLAMLTLNCSLYVGILRRKRVQIRRSLTSFNRLSASLTDRRNSVSSMPNFFTEASSSLDDNTELLLSSVKSKDTDTGGEEGENTTKANSHRSTASITDINTKLNFYSSSTTTYHQLQQHYLQNRLRTSSSLRSSVSMPQVHLNNVDNVKTVNDNKISTSIFNNNITNSLHTNSTPVAPMRRFSWAPRKASLALNRRSKGSEELAKDLLVRQDRKAACWLGLLVVVSLACWLPHTILRVLRVLETVELPAWVLDAAIWVQLANSSINPMLYGFFNKEIREAFKQWMRGGSRRKRAKFKNALLLNGCNLSSGANGHTSCARRMSLFDTVLE